MSFILSSIRGYRKPILLSILEKWGQCKNTVVFDAGPASTHESVCKLLYFYTDPIYPYFFKAERYKVMQLVIGSKNYSSWSMRPWLLLTHFGLEFEEVNINLFTPGFEKQLAKYSPTRKVPVLLDQGVEIWDSLAICEYISEQYLGSRAWPSSRIERAQCRAIACEMHSGFEGIRSDLPMNCRAKRVLLISETTRREIARIDELWSAAVTNSGGPYLFGDFSIADCMFAPIVSRFSTYQVTLSSAAGYYAEAIQGNSAVQAWLAEGRADPQIIDICEVGREFID